MSASAAQYLWEIGEITNAQYYALLTARYARRNGSSGAYKSHEDYPTRKQPDARRPVTRRGGGGNEVAR